MINIESSTGASGCSIQSVNTAIDASNQIIFFSFRAFLKNLKKTRLTRVMRTSPITAKMIILTPSISVLSLFAVCSAEMFWYLSSRTVVWFLIQSIYLSRLSASLWLGSSCSSNSSMPVLRSTA